MTNKQKWLVQNGFNSDGIIYLVGGGNTYEIKDLEIAELTNMGVKGTHVKIIDGVFLNIDDYID